MADDLPALLQHRQLVFAHGHRRSPEGGDVRRLTDGVAEEAQRDAGFEIPLLDFSLYRGVALHSGHRDQIHVVEGQLRQFGHHGLNKNGGFFGIKAAGQIIQRHLQNVAAHLLRVLGVVGQGLSVGDHDVDLVELAGVLQPDPLFQGTHVMADVKAAGRTVAGQNDLAQENAPLSAMKA